MALVQGRILQLNRTCPVQFDRKDIVFGSTCESTDSINGSLAALFRSCNVTVDIDDHILISLAKKSKKTPQIEIATNSSIFAAL